MVVDDERGELVPANDDDHEEPLLADSDADSAVGISDGELSSASLRSSLYNYQQENGMPYQTMKRGKYFLPVNEMENDRLDLQNEHFLLTFDGLAYHAPGGDTAKRVLDIGTGTGIWAVEYDLSDGELGKADAHPNAEVIGVDLAPIQPSFTPPNLYFQLDDVEDPWTWSRPFDYIFCRMMEGSFRDWGAFLKQVFDGLEPDGWVELIDSDFPLACDDGTLTPDNALSRWIAFLLEASNKLGRPLEVAKYHHQRLVDAGFENVVSKIFKWPINPWPRDRKYKEIGLWSLANVDGGLEGLSMALLTRGLGWSKEEVLVFLAEVRPQLRNKAIHAYWKIYVVYGQKPGGAVAPGPSGSGS